MENPLMSISWRFKSAWDLVGAKSIGGRKIVGATHNTIAYLSQEI